MVWSPRSAPWRGAARPPRRRGCRSPRPRRTRNRQALRQPRGRTPVTVGADAHGAAARRVDPESGEDVREIVQEVAGQQDIHGASDHRHCEQRVLRLAHAQVARKGLEPGFPRGAGGREPWLKRSEEHTSELQSQSNLVCRLLLEKKKKDTRAAER